MGEAAPSYRARVSKCGVSRLLAPAALLVCFGFAGPAFAQVEPPAMIQTDPGPVVPADRPADSIEVIRARALELVNAARQEHGLSPLVLDEELNQAAQVHADDMFARHYYAHESPEGKTARDRYIAAGGDKWKLVAENIARCSGCRPPRRAGILNRLQQWWMESPEHRANILEAGLTHFGFGMVVDEQRQLYAVQTFSGPGLPNGLQPEEDLAPLSAEDQARQAVRWFNLARARLGRAPLEFSAALLQAARGVLPERGLEDFDLNRRQGLLTELLRPARQRWQSFSVLFADCGGCGRAATAADVRYFAQQWLEDPNYKDDVLDPRVTHVGFIIAANGGGMKMALAVLGLAK